MQVKTTQRGRRRTDWRSLPAIEANSIALLITNPMSARHCRHKRKSEYLLRQIGQQ
jgi:hypothetical protein